MVEQRNTYSAGEPGSLPAIYRWLTTLFAVLIVAQAYFGTRGFFADPDLTTVHEMTANVMFLLVLGQTVVGWLLYNRGVLGMRDVVLNGVLVVLTVAQIGLGYSTRNGDNFATTISLHIPNGVLLMAVAAAVALIAWQTGGARSAGATAAGD